MCHYPCLNVPSCIPSKEHPSFKALFLQEASPDYPGMKWSFLTSIVVLDYFSVLRIVLGNVYPLLHLILTTTLWNYGSLLSPIFRKGSCKVTDVSQSCPTLCDPMDCSLPGSSIHGIFPGKSSGVGCYFLPQGLFPIQGSNLGLSYCRQTLYSLSHWGSQQMLRYHQYTENQQYTRQSTKYFSWIT